MSRVVMGPSKIEGRICPRTRVEDRGRYLGIPRTERFRILECPGNRVRYTPRQLKRAKPCELQSRIRLNHARNHSTFDKRGNDVGSDYRYHSRLDSEFAYDFDGSVI